MNKISAKLLSVLAIILFIAVMPIVVLATNENVSVVSSKNTDGKQEYIIYINEHTDQNFKYAFSNNAEPGIMDLVYINSTTDLGENQVAFLDAETYEKLSDSNKTIYMWAKDENEDLILNGIQLDFQNSITKENIETIESLTKRIKVEIADSKDDTDATDPVREEDVNGVLETSKVGYVEIVDDKDATYYYERVKVSDSADYTKLMELAEKIQKEYDSMDMYEKIQFDMEFYNLYSKLVNSANWQKVENMTISQPENSEKGEEYIVFLKKVDEDNNTVEDIQFLIADNYEEPKTEKVVTQETTKLPITGDNIALIVLLVVIVIALIVVFIRMKKMNKKDEEK